MEKTNLLLSTAYLPPLTYFSNIMYFKSIYIERFETYPKQTYRNRCEIYSANGKFALTIPVNKTNGNHTLTKDVEISNVNNWQKIHWRSIESAYANSPFYLYYSDLFKPFFEKKFKYLLDFNNSLLTLVLNILEIDIQINTTLNYIKQPIDTNDFRNTIAPKKNEISNNEQIPKYTQVFQNKYGFLPNLSIIDLIFNEGNYSKEYLLKIK